jgi:hypothetical protein
MSKYDYYIVDSEGFILLTLQSQNFATEEAAFASLLPVLNAVREQYGDEGATLERQAYSAGIEG